MMEIDELERIINGLTEEQVNILVDYYEAIIKDTEVNKTDIPKELKKVVMNFKKSPNYRKIWNLRNLILVLKGRPGYSEIIEHLEKIKKTFSESYYSIPLECVEEEELLCRLTDSTDEEINELLGLIKDVNENKEIDFSAVSLKNIGFIKSYMNFGKSEQEEVLSIVEDNLDEEYMEIVKELKAGVKDNNLDNLFNRLNQLSSAGQKTFINYMYDIGIEKFRKIAKEEQMAACEHDFGKWKDESYTCIEEKTFDYQPVDGVQTRVLLGKEEVKKVSWTKTCKKCGYQEVIDHIPKEVKEERKQKKNQKEQRKLEKRLAKIKEQARR